MVGRGGGGYLGLFFQDRLKLVELGLHGVHHSVGLLQLVEAVQQAVPGLAILSPLLSQQAGVQADQVHVALGAGVVPGPCTHTHSSHLVVCHSYQCAMAAPPDREHIRAAMAGCCDEQKSCLAGKPR